MGTQNRKQLKLKKKKHSKLTHFFYKNKSI